MRKKRVLLILGEFNTGGGERMLYELAQNIDPNEYEIQIICTGNASNTLLEKEVCNRFDVVFGNVNHLRVRTLVKIFTLIDRFKPDIIHAHLGGVVFAVPYAIIHPKSKLLITAHTRPDKAFDKKVERAIRWLVKHRENNIRIVAVSKKNAEDMTMWLNSNHMCAYVNNGIDVTKFANTIKHNQFTYINVASQNENKNQMAILLAFKKLKNECPNIKLILVGDGPKHRELVEFCNKNGLSEDVEFTGVVNDVYNYTAQADVFVQASFREAMPLSIIEAMASGLGIVATDVGGLRDVVDDNAILITPGNVEELYQAMKRFCDLRSDELDYYKKRSVELSAGFSSNEMAKEYMKLYREISS